MEWIALLTSATEGVNWIELGLTYGVLALIIIVSVVVLSIVKRSFRKEASLTKVCKKGEKAKAYAQKLLGSVNKAELLVAPTRLAKLSSMIADTEWNLSCLVEERKDIVLEGFATALDAVSTKLSLKAEEAFYTEEEYVSCLQDAINGLESVLNSVKEYQAAQKKA